VAVAIQKGSNGRLIVRFPYSKEAVARMHQCILMLLTKYNHSHAYVNQALGALKLPTIGIKGNARYAV